MHGMSSDIEEVKEIARQSSDYPEVDVGLCVPAILIERAARAAPGFAIGGQDVHQAERGAHTGCTSVEMLLDAGAALTIVGHSERRQEQRESDSDVKAKASAALVCGLNVILCVGESLEVRECGEAVVAVVSQLVHSLPDDLANNVELAVAYEPIWAIGTGKIPTSEEIAQMHLAIRDQLRARFGEKAGTLRILYGGSVKSSNSAEIFTIANVDGALVGGASLKAVDFIPIVASAAGQTPELG